MSINTLTKHFVGCKNSFCLVFVLIWHFNSIISSHFNSTEQLHRLIYEIVSFNSFFFKDNKYTTETQKH